MKYLSLVIITCSVFFLVGCGNHKNGVSLPSKEDSFKRSHYKIYVTDELNRKNESDMAQFLKELFKNQIKVPGVVQIKDDIDYTTLSTTKVNDFISSGKSDDDFSVGYKNLSKDEFKTLLKEITYKKGESTLTYNLINDDGIITTETQYKSQSDILKDYMNIQLILSIQLRNTLSKKFGLYIYTLDGDALRKNQLRLIPITRHFSIANLMKEHFKTYGYTLVDNKDEANRVIEFETLAFTQIKLLKDLQKQTYIKSNREKRDNANIGATAMYGTSLLGGSNNTSAAVGAVGLAFVALDFLTSKDEDDYGQIVLSKHYNVKDPNEYTLIQHDLNSYSSLNLINYYYKGNDTMGYDIKYNKISQSIQKFIDEGKYSKYDGKVLKLAKIHEQGLYNQKDIKALKYVEEKPLRTTKEIKEQNIKQNKEEDNSITQSLTNSLNSVMNFFTNDNKTKQKDNNEKNN